MISEGMKPTRTQLKELKETLALSHKGHELLEEKNEALMLEHFTMSKDMELKKKDSQKKISEAFIGLEKAQETIGHVETRYLGASVADAGLIKIDNKKIMGINLLKIDAPDFSRDILERGYNIADSNAFLDNAAHLFEESLPKILKVGEIDSNSRILKKEIAKTRRKVTALEDFIIPSLKTDSNFIIEKLEERAREDFVRTKKVKNKIR